MQELIAFRDHLINNLKLDPTYISVWVESGKLGFVAGKDNKSYSVSYEASVTIESFSGAIDQLLYFAKQFLCVNQPLNAGEKKLQFEYELLKKDEYNVYLSVPVSEIIKVTIDETGTGLTSVVAPDLEQCPPAPFIIPIEHVPDGENQG